MSYHNTYDGGNSIENHLKGVVMALSNTTRLNIPPKSRAVLEQFGDIPINRIYVIRRPLGKLYSNAVKFMNMLSRYTPKTHDQFFHLLMVCDLNGMRVKIEKNEEINIEKWTDDIPQQDYVIFSKIPEGLTMNQMIANTVKAVGDYRVFHYDHVSLNCQRFQMDLLESNGIITPENKQQVESFIMQNINDITNIWSRILAQKATSLKNQLNMAVEGWGNDCN